MPFEKVRIILKVSLKMLRIDWLEKFYVIQRNLISVLVYL